MKLFWNFVYHITFQFLVHFKVHCPDSVSILCNTQCYFVPCSAHYSKIALKNALFCEQSFVFLSNTNSASTSAAASLLLAYCRTKRVSSWLGQTRCLPCEVSFYKIQPRQKRLAGRENDLEIVLLCFEKYHAWSVCELQSSKMIPLRIWLRKIWPGAVQWMQSYGPSHGLTIIVQMPDMQRYPWRKSDLKSCGHIAENVAPRRGNL